jgi:predicted DNA-binding transcriptional regulator YafY
MQAIDQALRAQKWPTDKTLAADLEVDPRTIRRDIEFLRDERNAPIEYDRARGGYFYAEPTYQLPLVQMTEGELLGLYLSERMLRQFHGTPFEADLRQAIAKMADMLPDNVTVRLDSIGDFLSVLPAVEAEYDPDSFCALLRAVVGQRQLDMVYWTASRNESYPPGFRSLRALTRRRWLVCLRLLSQRGRNPAVRCPAGAIGEGDGRNVRPPGGFPRRR